MQRSFLSISISVSVSVSVPSSFSRSLSLPPLSEAQWDVRRLYQQRGRPLSLSFPLPSSPSLPSALSLPLHAHTTGRTDLHQQRVQHPAPRGPGGGLLCGPQAAVGGGELVEEDRHDDVDEHVAHQHLPRSRVPSDPISTSPISIS